jgi:uncharacterized protein YbjT (DUF2867 family)
MGSLTSELLTVVGSTGTQGLSLIKSALNDGRFRIRALTRNPNSSQGRELSKRGVEIVRADLNDQTSLVEAFEAGRPQFKLYSTF